MRPLPRLLISTAITLTLMATNAASAADKTPPKLCGVGDAAHPLIVGQTYYGHVLWQGEKPDALRVTFLPDCTVDYVFDDGGLGWAEWGQVGKDVVLNVNSGYAVYNGELTGDRLVGSLKNKYGKTGTFAFDRK